MRHSHRMAHLETHFRNSYSFALGGGSSRATTLSLNPVRLCDPSQNGLFADCPHRHSPIVVRPASPNTAPCGSTISKSPSTRIDPLFAIVIFVVAIAILLGRFAKPTTYGTRTFSSLISILRH